MRCEWLTMPELTHLSRSGGVDGWVSSRFRPLRRRRLSRILEAWTGNIPGAGPARAVDRQPAPSAAVGRARTFS